MKSQMLVCFLIQSYFTQTFLETLIKNLWRDESSKNADKSTFIHNKFLRKKNWKPKSLIFLSIWRQQKIEFRILYF